MDDIEKLRLLATRVREAIEMRKHELSAACGPKSDRWEQFPKCCCAMASFLLAKVLRVNGFGQFNMVSGQRLNERTNDLELHHWLEQDSVIVDITADQFPDSRDELIIVTTDNKWHNTFSIERRVYVADYEKEKPQAYAAMFDIIAGSLEPK